MSGVAAVAGLNEVKDPVSVGARMNSTRWCFLNTLAQGAEPQSVANDVRATPFVRDRGRNMQEVIVVMSRSDRPSHRRVLAVTSLGRPAGVKGIAPNSLVTALASALDLAMTIPQIPARAMCVAGTRGCFCRGELQATWNVCARC